MPRAWAPPPAPGGHGLALTELALAMPSCALGGLRPCTAPPPPDPPAGPAVLTEPGVGGGNREEAADGAPLPLPAAAPAPPPPLPCRRARLSFSRLTVRVRPSMGSRRFSADSVASICAVCCARRCTQNASCRRCSQADSARMKNSATTMLMLTPMAVLTAPCAAERIWEARSLHSRPVEADTSCMESTRLPVSEYRYATAAGTEPYILVAGASR